MTGDFIRKAMATKEIKLKLFCDEMGRKVSAINAEADSKLRVLRSRLVELSKQGQVVIFTYYVNTLDYIFENVSCDPVFANVKIEKKFLAG